MGEEIAGLPEAPAIGPRALGSGAAPADTAGFATQVEVEPIGAYLSRQRRLRGIRLEDLARTTCIPLRSLERLEAGAFDGTPDGFARGFVRTVAGALGLDCDDAVRRMLPEARPGPRRARKGPRPDPKHWARSLLAGLAAAALALLLFERTGGDPSASELQSQRVFRRDAVRELARSQGWLPPRAAAARLPGGR